MSPRSLRRNFLMALKPTFHRHALRHQGLDQEALRRNCRQPRLFRRFRSLRRFRPDIRGGQAQPENSRNPGSLCRPQLRRDADLPIRPRLALGAHGAVCLQEAKGALISFAPRLSNLKTALPWWVKIAAKLPGGNNGNTCCRKFIQVYFLTASYFTVIFPVVPDKFIF